MLVVISFICSLVDCRPYSNSQNGGGHALRSDPKNNTKPVLVERKKLIKD